MVNTIIYTLSDCPTCIAAKKDLRNKGIEFEERIVDNDPRWREEAKRLSGSNTVPVIVHNGEVTVGFGGRLG